MRKNFLTLLLCTLFVIAAGLPAFAASFPLGELSEVLRNRIEAGGSPARLIVADEPILASQELPGFYEKRGYTLAWFGRTGMTRNVRNYMETLRQADEEGLDPADYHFTKIKNLISLARDMRSPPVGNDGWLLVDLDLLLTDSYLLYASHLLSGRINPATIDPEWKANRREADLAEVLSQAIEGKNIAQSLQRLLPPQDGYRNLRKAYQQYRKLETAGGWRGIEGGENLERGQTDARVEQVRKTLIRLGYLHGKEKGPVFDEGLEDVIRYFQLHHGLAITGVVDQETMKALGTPPAQRVRQIQVNLERWRWLPQDMGERYVLVNIANFDLEVIENGKTVLAMRAIVGKHYRRTPVFSGRISYVVLNPFWHVPQNIAVQDILPLVQKDPAYLSQKKIHVFQGWGGDAPEVDPKGVDWNALSVTQFPYRFRQDPGPQNALGKVKFMFPNDFNVYLHDTSSPELFSRDQPRTFSSGCIRIEKPMDLLVFLTSNNSEYSQTQIGDWLKSGQERTVKLKDAVPVHLLYWTSWADPDGTVQFRDDIYLRDERLFTALEKKPPEGSQR